LSPPPGLLLALRTIGVYSGAGCEESAPVEPGL